MLFRSANKDPKSLVRDVMYTASHVHDVSHRLDQNGNTRGRVFATFKRGISTKLCSNRTKHFYRIGQAYNVAKVVHGKRSDNDCNRSHTWSSTLLLELY